MLCRCRLQWAVVLQYTLTKIQNRRQQRTPPLFVRQLTIPRDGKTSSESRGWRESAGFRRSCAKVTREKNDSLWIQSCYRHRGSTSLLFLILAAIKLIFVIKIIQNDEFSLNFIFERELVHDRRHVARQTRETSGWLWSKGG